MQVQSAGYDSTIMVIATDTEGEQIRMAGTPSVHGENLFEIEA